MLLETTFYFNRLLLSFGRIVRANLNRIVWENAVIKFKCSLQDGTYLQKLIQPMTDKGQKRTLQDLLNDFSTPVRKAGR